MITTSNSYRNDHTNHTEYYDKLLYYTATPARGVALVEYYLNHSVKCARRSHGGGGRR